jgi:hypothetical protein
MLYVCMCVWFSVCVCLGCVSNCVRSVKLNNESSYCWICAVAPHKEQKCTLYNSYFLSLDISSPVLCKSADICSYLSLMNSPSVSRETKWRKISDERRKKTFICIFSCMLIRIQLLPQNSLVPKRRRQFFNRNFGFHVIIQF